MADKPKKQQPTVQPLPAKKLTKEEAEKVKGGMRSDGQCEETGDTGVMGCPG